MSTILLISPLCSRFFFLAGSKGSSDPRGKALISPLLVLGFGRFDPLPLLSPPRQERERTTPLRKRGFLGKRPRRVFDENHGSKTRLPRRFQVEMITLATASPSLVLS